MGFSVSINFNGNCREAVTFYAGVFEQEIPHFLTYGQGDTSFDSNFQVSEAMLTQIMHVALNIEGTVLEFNDMPDAFPFERGNSIYLTVNFENWEKAQAVFHGLAEGGRADVPFGEFPGQGYYGMVSDAFGLGWIIRA